MGEQNKPDFLNRLSTAAPHILLLLVLLFIGLSYSNTLHSPPVLDDRKTFIINPAVYIDNLSCASLEQIFTGRFGATRFLPMLSFAIDHLLGQGSITQFHLTNILVHMLATIAAYFLVLGLTNTAIGQKRLFFLTPGQFSLWVAALWALHPVQSNCVTYLVQRMASLAALFYFAALAGYVWARISKSPLARTINWAVFLLATLCAFLSKENSATLPVAVLIIELIFIRPELVRKTISRISWHYWLILTAIFLLILPFAASQLSAISGSYVAHGRHFNMTERLFTELRVVVFYLSLLALPLPGRFNLDHDFPLSHSLLNPPATLLAFFLLVALVLTALRIRHRNPFISFGIIFFFLNLLIESSIIPLELVFEHRLYLPSLGFFVVVVAVLDWGCQLMPVANRKELKKIFFLGMVITTCTLAITTSLRNHVWRDKLTLYNDIARKSPLKPRVQTNLGKELLANDRHEEALAALQNAISLGKGQSEEYINAANNIITIFVSQERFQEAADRAEELIRERPPERLNFDGFPMLMANLGVSYWKLGRFNDSLEAFRIGVKTHHPLHTPLLLGGMEAMLREAAASEEGSRQLALDNGAGAVYCKMATALLLDKDYTNARTYLNKALAVNPADEKTLAIESIFDEETARNRLARAEISGVNQPPASTGFRFKSVIYLAAFFEERYPLLKNLIGPLLEKAVKLEPDSLLAALKLASWQLQHGEADKALILAQRHLLAKPDFPPLLELAGQCYFAKGENELAAAMLNKLLEVYPGHPQWNRYGRFVRAYYQSSDKSAQ